MCFSLLYHSFGKRKLQIYLLHCNVFYQKASEEDTPGPGWVFVPCVHYSPSLGLVHQMSNVSNIPCLATPWRSHKPGCISLIEWISAFLAETSDPNSFGLYLMRHFLQGSSPKSFSSGILISFKFHGNQVHMAREFLYQFGFQSGTCLAIAIPFCVTRTNIIKRQKDPFVVVFISPCRWCMQ